MVNQTTEQLVAVITPLEWSAKLASEITEMVNLKNATQSELLQNTVNKAIVDAACKGEKETIVKLGILRGIVPYLVTSRLNERGYDARIRLNKEHEQEILVSWA